eukprot:326357-Prymnesium_polylepis.1
MDMVDMDMDMDNGQWTMDNGHGTWTWDMPHAGFTRGSCGSARGRARLRAHTRHGGATRVGVGGEGHAVVCADGASTAPLWGGAERALALVCREATAQRAEP